MKTIPFTKQTIKDSNFANTADFARRINQPYRTVQKWLERQAAPVAIGAFLSLYKQKSTALARLTSHVLKQHYEIDAEGKKSVGKCNCQQCQDARTLTYTPIDRII